MTPQERQGWFIVGCLFVAMLLVFGSGYDTTPTFMPALLKTFGWSRAKTSFIPSLLALSLGLCVIPVGWLLDRVEAKFVMLAGTIAAGGAFLLASHAHSFAEMAAAYLLLGVGIAAGTVMPAAFVVANWFGARRGLAMGITSAGTTTGGMLMNLAAAKVIGAHGLRAAYFVLAVPIFVIVVPLVMLTVRSRPPGAQSMTVAEAGARLEGFETSAAFRTRSFWMIVIAQFCFALAATGVLIHFNQYLIDLHYSAALAATAVSVSFGITTVGKVLMGLFADRITARIALAVSFAIQAVALVLALGAANPWLMALFVLTFGATFAVPLMLIPLLIAESMGLRRYGSISGITAVANTIGAALGPIVSGWIFDFAHSYTIAFEAYIVIYILGAIASWACRPYSLEREITFGAPAAVEA
jgi:MFS family permease